MFVVLPPTTLNFIFINFLQKSLFCPKKSKIKTKIEQNFCHKNCEYNFIRTKIITLS
jgi:hypothetical protein